MIFNALSCIFMCIISASGMFILVRYYWPFLMESYRYYGLFVGVLLGYLLGMLLLCFLIIFIMCSFGVYSIISSC